MKEEAHTPPPVPIWTYAATVTTVVVFVGQTVSGAPQAAETLRRWGYRTGWEIWSGEYWALFSSVFVHGGVLHFAFNLYWLWILGRAVEQALGRGYYLLLFVAAAWLSSACQLAVSDGAGIGLSGVGYALFGFAWLARSVSPALRKVVDEQLVSLFLGWLVVCLVLSWWGYMNVGNTAHFAGLVFGGLAAGTVLPRWRRLAAPGLVLFCVLGSVPLVWAPWSPTWNSLTGLEAYERGDYEDAIERFTRVIDRRPAHAWAYWKRGWARIRLRDYVRAIADFTTVLALGPDHSYALKGRGRARRMSRDYDGAIEDLTAALERDADDAWAWTERGWARNGREEYDAAIVDFTRALELGDRNTFALVGRARAHRNERALDAAITDATRAIELSETYALAWEERAAAREAKGDIEGAAADRERARELRGS